MNLVIKPSRLKYHYPLPINQTTTQPSPQLLARLSGQLQKLDPFTIETGSPAHQGLQAAAIDFIVPSHTPVLAAAAGQVIRVCDHYFIPKPFQQIGFYWLTRCFRPFVNLITLKHQSQGITEYSHYLHLKKNSLQVKLNQSVKPGQLLAQTGWSGWMDRPHLHFAVFSQQALTPTWQKHLS